MSLSFAMRKVYKERQMRHFAQNRFKYKSGAKILENKRILLVIMIKIMLLYTLLTLLLLFEDLIGCSESFWKSKNLKIIS